LETKCRAFFVPGLGAKAKFEMQGDRFSMFATGQVCVAEIGTIFKGGEVSLAATVRSLPSASDCRVKELDDHTFDIDGDGGRNPAPFVVVTAL
jgi:hypothetical protein